GSRLVGQAAATKGSMLSLDRAVALALVDNLGLAAARQDVNVEAFDRDLAASRYRPNLYLEATGRMIDETRARAALGQEPERLASGGVVLEQLLFSEPALAAMGIADSLDRARRAELEVLLGEHPALQGRLILLDGQAREAMVASDAVLLASGTAALEAMLCHRPMVVAYRLAPATYWLAKRLVKTEWISLPNLIARETLVPELIQDEASAGAIAQRLDEMLDDAPGRAELETRFAEMHEGLQRDASRRAAEAIEALVAGLPLPASVAPERAGESVGKRAGGSGP
ncbi:MAG: hypothetical protein ABR580_00770, partial [Halomonas sp.]